MPVWHRHHGPGHFPLGLHFPLELPLRVLYLLHFREALIRYDEAKHACGTLTASNLHAMIEIA